MPDPPAACWSDPPVLLADYSAEASFSVPAFTLADYSDDSDHWFNPPAQPDFAMLDLNSKPDPMLVLDSSLALDLPTHPDFAMPAPDFMPTHQFRVFLVP